MGVSAGRVVVCALNRAESSEWHHVAGIPKRGGAPGLYSLSGEVQ